MVSDAKRGRRGESRLAIALRSVAALSLVVAGFVGPTGLVALVIPLTTATAGQAALVFAALPTPGGVFVTGHASDFHASQGPNATGARNIIKKAVGYVTQDKANPSMLLVTDLRHVDGHSDPRP